MSKRRNPFETSELAPAPTAPPSIYESLRMASPRKRKRQWEKEHQSQKAVYRGIDPKLALKVKSIADDLLVPTGEVARVLIEFALRAHAQGDLDLNPRPNPSRMRMTLFPTSGLRRLYDEPARSARKAKGKQPEALWKVITTWRGFPPELKRGLAMLASEDGLNVPVGELITALLCFGLRAYNYGLVSLEPVQKATRFTLTLNGGK
ncbi:MAG: hypothetical protein EHM40_02630 [Chloroflexi bacterium]|nr:MAG: hypothetical protein EHM40_02630 [Chloroflexota bacterium]